MLMAIFSTAAAAMGHSSRLSKYVGHPRFIVGGLCQLLIFGSAFVAPELKAEDKDADLDSAQNNRSPYSIYVEPFYGTAIIDQIRSSGIGTGEDFEGDIDGRVREGRLDDGVAGLGLRLERDFENWQIGLALSWRYRTDWDLTARTFSIESITNVFSDVETRSVTFEFGRHWWRGKHRFAFDAGAGLVRNRIESEYLEREVPGVRGQRRFEAKRTPKDLAWNLTLSWHKKLGAQWLLGARYRYSNLGDFATGTFNGRPAELSARHRSHDLIVSFGRGL